MFRTIATQYQLDIVFTFDVDIFHADLQIALDISHKCTSICHHAPWTHDFDVPPMTPQSDLGLYYYWSGGHNHKQGTIAYHAYTADRFVQDFPQIRSQDIFARADTLNLYLKESQINITYE